MFYSNVPRKTFFDICQQNHYMPGKAFLVMFFMAFWEIFDSNVNKTLYNIIKQHAGKATLYLSLKCFKDIHVMLFMEVHKEVKNGIILTFLIMSIKGKLMSNTYFGNS